MGTRTMEALHTRLRGASTRTLDPAETSALLKATREMVGSPNGDRQRTKVRPRPADQRARVGNPALVRPSMPTRTTRTGPAAPLPKSPQPDAASRDALDLFESRRGATPPSPGSNRADLMPLAAGPHLAPQTERLFEEVSQLDVDKLYGCLHVVATRPQSQPQLEPIKKPGRPRPAGRSSPEKREPKKALPPLVAAPPKPTPAEMMQDLLSSPAIVAPQSGRYGVGGDGVYVYCYAERKESRGGSIYFLLAYLYH